MVDAGGVRPNGNGKVPSLTRNYVSLVGLALAVVAFGNIIFLFLVDVFSPHPSPYIGIFAYMVMPAFLVLGLALVPVGMLMERSRRRKQAPTDIPKFPRIDLNNPAQRSSVAFFLSFVVIFVILSAVGSYRAYEYTDSVQFCGQLCHSVMNPEFTAYQLSPHARVACVDCHVGAGAGWYVRSKLSGARQVFKTALGTFPRPIPTPVKNLRPAQDTCEQCHWPKKFWGAQLKTITHYSYDEQNTARELQMLIKTGGGDPTAGTASGIHWHMNIANKISYVSDEKRQDIPYVRMEDPQGRVTEYRATSTKLTPEEIKKTPTRRMDCVDCHNRPTHIYVPPDRSVDESITAKRISVELPFIKQQGVTALTGEYKTTDEAMQGISTSVTKFYSEKYPAIASSKQNDVRNAVTELQRIYRSTSFPEMKLDWRTHQNNVGHFYYQGCFRCHDNNHTSADGKTISKDCTVCHTLLSQSEGGKMEGSAQGVAFKHPIDLGDMSQVNCSDCHTGGPQ